MIAEHTPTPWNASGLTIRKANSLIAVMGQDDGIKYSEEVSLANAEHIVKCVNLHDELVKALEIAAQYVPQVLIDFYQVRDTPASGWATIVAALSKARGEA